MTKQSGLGDRLYIGGYDLSGDISALGRIAGGPAALDVTGIDESAMERIGGLRDGGIDATAFFNAAAGQAHPVLSALPTADVHLMYCRGATAGKPAACQVSKQVNYDGTRGTDGSLTFAVSAQANAYGLEWATQLTDGAESVSGAGALASVDFTSVDTGFGLQAYLQVISFTGTDATITIQESSDDGSGDAFANVTGGAFTQVTAAPVTERIYTGRTQTVERYLRVNVTTSGGFSEMAFAVAVARNDTAVLFG